MIYTHESKEERGSEVKEATSNYLQPWRNIATTSAT
jgi:hypothetical protein